MDENDTSYFEFTRKLKVSEAISALGHDTENPEASEATSGNKSKQTAKTGWMQRVLSRSSW